MDSDRFMDELQLRTQSMGILHRLLYSGKGLSHVFAGDFFEDVVSNVLKVYGMNDVALICEMEDFDIPLDTAVPLGLILAELTSNSCKYAVRGITKPEFQIKFYKSDKNEIEQECLVFADNGQGFSDSTNSKRGFGTKLINMDVENLNATYSFRYDNGLIFEMILPLNKNTGLYSPS